MPVCPVGKYLENSKRKFRTWHHLGSAGNIGEDNLHLNVNWTWFANWDWHMYVTNLLQLYECTCAIIARALSAHMTRLWDRWKLCKIVENMQIVQDVALQYIHSTPEGNCANQTMGAHTTVPWNHMWPSVTIEDHCSQEIWRTCGGRSQSFLNIGDSSDSRMSFKTFSKEVFLSLCQTLSAPQGVLYLTTPGYYPTPIPNPIPRIAPRYFWHFWVPIWQWTSLGLHSQCQCQWVQIGSKHARTTFAL